MSGEEKKLNRNPGGKVKSAAGNWQHLTHEFGPLFDAHSKILILGSFPSAKSREQQFYYGHPRNRFWKIMAAVCAEADRAGEAAETERTGESAEADRIHVRDNHNQRGETAAFIQETAVSDCVPESLKSKAVSVPETVAEKKALLLEHGIALWDVIESCDIRGSSDASIRNARVNDLALVFNHAPIRKVYVNGGTAWKLYEKYMEQQCRACGIEAERLPSTSPANAAWPLERLFGEWRIIADDLK